MINSFLTNTKYLFLSFPFLSLPSSFSFINLCGRGITYIWLGDNLLIHHCDPKRSKTFPFFIFMQCKYLVVCGISLFFFLLHSTVMQNQHYHKYCFQKLGCVGKGGMFVKLFLMVWVSWERILGTCNILVRGNFFHRFFEVLSLHKVHHLRMSPVEVLKMHEVKPKKKRKKNEAQERPSWMAFCFFTCYSVILLDLATKRIYLLKFFCFLKFQYVCRFNLSVIQG